MRPGHADDVSADGVDRLRCLAPDPHRAERVRVRCRTRLERSRRGVVSTDARTGRARRLLAPVLIGGVCAFYLVALVATALQLQGLL